MKNIIQKSYLRSNMIISEFFEKWKHYSFLYAIYSTAWWIGWYLRLSSLTRWAYSKKRQYIFNYLENNFQEVIEEYKIKEQGNVVIDEYPIWVFWAQGFENAPELVRMCNFQLQKEQRDVRVVTMDNFHEYVEIPDYVIEAVQNGKRTLTHFSDIIRVSLLDKYGGIWVDSTCYLPYTIPAEIKSLSFISPKTKNISQLPLPSNSRWCGWSMGTNIKENILFRFTKEVLCEHTKRNCLIDYLFIDYVIEYAYENLSIVKTMIDNCPENNIKRNQLHFMLNKVYSQKGYVNLIDNNWIFKLSYKTPWIKKVNNSLTYYGRLIDDNKI